jgi:hypothetical protein
MLMAVIRYLEPPTKILDGLRSIARQCERLANSTERASMPTYYVCLDTNILIDALDALRDDKPLAGWDDFELMIKSKKAKLLVSQVTLLEFEKNVIEAEGKILFAKAEGPQQEDGR